MQTAATQRPQAKTTATALTLFLVEDTGAFQDWNDYLTRAEMAAAFNRAQRVPA